MKDYQKQMIEELTAQFNSTETTAKIDVNAIIQKIYEHKKRRADIELYNETFKTLHNQVLLDGVTPLLNDLLPFDIVSVENVLYGNLRVFVGIAGMYQLDWHNYVFSFDTEVKTEGIYLTDQQDAVYQCINCKYRFLANFGSGSKSGLSFDSVPEMLSDLRVVNKITELIAGRLR
jgi:hypothetical protein